LRRPATLKSLGQILGVSPSLISRVLRNDRNGRVSEAKRAEILAAARTSGYRPNHAGRALRNQKTKIIALAVPDVINPFYATLFGAVESAALARDYTVILCNTDESSERFTQLFEYIGNRHVDGWLIATATGQDPYRACGAKTQPSFCSTGARGSPASHGSVRTTIRPDTSEPIICCVWDIGVSDISAQIFTSRA
jgi:DNA-binding LacI/PurR family transcriptional regulator